MQPLLLQMQMIVINIASNRHETKGLCGVNYRCPGRESHCASVANKSWCRPLRAPTLRTSRRQRWRRSILSFYLHQPVLGDHCHLFRDRRREEYIVERGACRRHLLYKSLVQFDVSGVDVFIIFPV